MVQCTAFTKKHRRCLKQALKEEKTCQYHQTYYANWFETHPPLKAFRLNIDEKHEYRFQIENNHVEITNEYVQSFSHKDFADYYEYLLHLPHIQWDTNMRMLVRLIMSFLNQPNCIHIDEKNIQYYFHNMFKNPSFYCGDFLMRLLFVIEEQSKRGNFLNNLTESRTKEIYNFFLKHPIFEGFMYMSWETSLCKQLHNSKVLPIFLTIWHTTKKEWLEEKRQKISPVKKELLEIAMQPARVQDWYLDYETKKEINRFFAK